MVAPEADPDQVEIDFEMRGRAVSSAAVTSQCTIPGQRKSKTSEASSLSGNFRSSPRQLHTGYAALKGLHICPLLIIGAYDPELRPSVIDPVRTGYAGLAWAGAAANRHMQSPPTARAPPMSRGQPGRPDFPELPSAPTKSRARREGPLADAFVAEYSPAIASFCTLPIWAACGRMSLMGSKKSGSANNLSITSSTSSTDFPTTDTAALPRPVTRRHFGRVSGETERRRSQVFLLDVHRRDRGRTFTPMASRWTRRTSRTIAGIHGVEITFRWPTGRVPNHLWRRNLATPLRFASAPRARVWYSALIWVEPAKTQPTALHSTRRATLMSPATVRSLTHYLHPLWALTQTSSQKFLVAPLMPFRFGAQSIGQCADLFDLSGRLR